MGEPEDERAVFLGNEETGIEGVVVADLDGEDGDSDDDSMEEDESSGEFEYEEALAQSRDDSIHCFQGHKGPVFGVAWSRKGDGIVYSGGEDETAACWKVITDADHVEDLETSRLQGHKDSIIQVSFSTSGDILATAGMDGVVKTWKHPSCDLLQTLDGPGDAIEWIDWHPKGDVVLAGSGDYSMWMWNATTGACMQVFSGHSDAVTCGGFTPDGRLAVGGGDDSDPSLKVFDPKSGNCLQTIGGHGFHESGLTCIAFLPDSSITITGSTDNTARIANLQNGKVMGTLKGHSDCVEFCCLVEGSLPLLLTGSLDGKVLAWDQGSLAKRQELSHPYAITAMKPIPASNLLVTGSVDGVVRVWDIRSSSCVRELHGFEETVQCVEVSPDSKHILAGGDDSTVRVFEL